MVDYEQDVFEDAKDLFLDNDDMFKEAIKNGTDFDRNDISGLDTIFHETIVDRSYAADDAVFILENCENEETDSGLWEGIDDWRDQLAARAAYSYGNDVWFKAEELYNELREKYGDLADVYEYWIDTVNQIECDKKIFTEDALEEVRDKLIEGFDEYGIPFDKDQFLEAINTGLPEDFLVNLVFKEFELRYTIKPINPDSQEALDLLRRWIKLGENAGMWSGYPLGSSYIDARCGTGHGMPDVYDYVNFDHEVAYKLPALSGKRKEVIVEEIKRLEKIVGKTG